MRKMLSTEKVVELENWGGDFVIHKFDKSNKPLLFQHFAYMDPPFTFLLIFFCNILKVVRNYLRSEFHLQ